MNLPACLTTETIMRLMHDFHTKNISLPNTILLPALDSVNEIKIESIFGMKVVYAAVTEPQVCLR